MKIFALISDGGSDEGNGMTGEYYRFLFLFKFAVSFFIELL